LRLKRGNIGNDNDLWECVCVCVKGMEMAGTEPRENPSASQSNGASDLSDNLITRAQAPVH